MSNNFNTLEAAQAEILRLNEELTRTTNERDALQTTNNTLTEENENLHKLNQSYFNKLSAQYLPDDQDEDDEPEILTCEEFANTLNI